MKESPNKNDPEADVKFIVEELLNLFNEAECDGGLMQLESSVGSAFHARVLNASAYLGLSFPVTSLSR